MPMFSKSSFWVLGFEGGRRGGIQERGSKLNYIRQARDFVTTTANNEVGAGDSEELFHPH